MEQNITLPDNIDLSVFYGVNNANMHLLKDLFPQLKLVARGTALKISGSNNHVSHFQEILNDLCDYCATTNSLSEDVIRQTAAGSKVVPTEQKHLILYGVGGKPIMARTENQRRLVQAFANSDLLFAVGPAGSGKTYTAIALAVHALKNKEVRKIILSRPAVEAGEKLGFLPGDMRDKIDPYLQPLYDALQDMLPPAKLEEFMTHNVVQIAPLAFMRGRTLSDAVIILDEAQNTNTQQIKMFLTRMGMNSKMIVTGDLTQIDLPPWQKSGLCDALEVLDGVRGVERIDFDQKDIVRHRLVQRIVNAYEARKSKEQTIDKNQR